MKAVILILVSHMCSQQHSGRSVTGSHGLVAMGVCRMRSILFLSMYILSRRTVHGNSQRLKLVVNGIPKKVPSSHLRIVFCWIYLSSGICSPLLDTFMCLHSRLLL